MPPTVVPGMKKGKKGKRAKEIIVEEEEIKEVEKWVDDGYDEEAYNKALRQYNELQKKAKQKGKFNGKFKKVLVVLLFVSDYDKMNNLPGTANDKKRLYELFRDYYKYKVIQTKYKRVTYQDFIDKLTEAREEFRNRDYHGIMIFYGGHGDKNWLNLSDRKIPRLTFERWFNGIKVVEKADAFKFYFIDSCRGKDSIKQDAGGKAMGDQSNNDAVEDEYKGDINQVFHPEKNKIILHGNCNGYKSYQVPYNVYSKDIDWMKMTQSSIANVSEWCGVFSNAVYWCFRENIRKNYGNNWCDSLDMIIDLGMCNALGAESEKEEAMRKKYKSKYEQQVRIDSGIKRSDERKLWFKENKPEPVIPSNYNADKPQWKDFKNPPRKVTEQIKVKVPKKKIIYESVDFGAGPLPLGPELEDSEDSDY